MGASPAGAAAPVTAADWLTLVRVPIAVALAVVALAWGAQARVAIVVIACLGAVTDVLDGWWARRSGTASERGARWDSAADVAFTGALAVAVLLAVPRDAWAPVAIVAILVVTAVRVAVVVIRGRAGLAPITHSMANKASGVVAFAAALCAILAGALPADDARTLVTWAVVVAALAGSVAAFGDLPRGASDRDSVGPPA